jgi:TRAP-type C4-dicarboxylate transport system permease small subunit
MLRIMAVIFIVYGMIELFLRNFRQNSAAQRMPRPNSMRARFERLKAVLPAYIVVVAGTLMLIASFVR